MLPATSRAMPSIASEAGNISFSCSTHHLPLSPARRGRRENYLEESSFLAMQAAAVSFTPRPTTGEVRSR